MKHNSKQFLALFMAASMAVAPVSGSVCGRSECEL